MENLSASSIRAIIKACKENHVSKFSFAGLTVEFDVSKGNNQEIIQHVPTEVLLEKPEESLKERANRQKQQFEDLLEESRLADPGLYEELVQIGELADAGDSKA